MPQSPSSILIIRYTSMGDVILTAPLIAFLRELFPGTHLTLLTLKYYSNLFKDDRRLSVVFGVNKNEYCSAEELSEKQWDLIIDLQNNRQSAAQVALLQYKTIRRFDKLHFKRAILLMFRINRYNPVETVALRYIRTCGETPPSGRLDFSLTINKGENGPFNKMVQPGEIRRPVVVFFPFSAWKNKEWDERSFISVGQYFIIKGWNVVLMGGPREKERAFRMKLQIGERCISLAGEVSLYECGQLLQHCHLALGCDTGLSHLARACGVKTGFLYGPTTSHFGFQPQNDPNCIVFESKHFCRPCHPHGGNICWRINHDCMRSISPDMVIAGLMELFHR